MHRQPTTSRQSNAQRLRIVRRRGVASVLAMMFLVIFGSLAAAMAVVAQGNMRTADSSLKVSRAQSAAESGLVFAERRLSRESKRFVVEKGVIDAGFASRLWTGTWNGTDGEVEILPPDGFDGPATPDGLVEALRDAHLADVSAFAPLAEHTGLPEIYDNGALVTLPMRLETGVDRLWFQLLYEPIAGTNRVRVTSLGVDGRTA
jgi:hypothetical protein